MSNHCHVCHTDKQEDELAISPRTGKKVSVCLPCWDKHYAHLCKSSQEHKAKQKLEGRSCRKKQIARNREYLATILMTAKCMDCPENDWLVLELDHRDPTQKHDAVTRMVNDGVSLERIKVEVAKCDIVCANCHTRRTIKRAKSWRLTFVNHLSSNPP